MKTPILGQVGKGNVCDRATDIWDKYLAKVMQVKVKFVNAIRKYGMKVQPKLGTPIRGQVNKGNVCDHVTDIWKYDNIYVSISL